MITAFEIRNFKSFAAAQVPLVAVTFLIGANASGKTNFLEALRVLNRLASGQRMNDLVWDLTKRRLHIRGSADDLFLAATKPICLGCSVKSESQEGCRLDIEIAMFPDILDIVAESLSIKNEEKALYEARIRDRRKPAWPASGGLDLSAFDPVPFEISYGGNECREVAFFSQLPIFYQLAISSSSPPQATMGYKIFEAANAIRISLRDIFFLEPEPDAMRGYTAEEDILLQENGANVASTLKKICEDGHKKGRLLKFIRALPEQNIRDISFITTERHDVMLRLEETFGGKKKKIDAPLLSDGTLRILAMAAFLLSVPKGSLAIIEDVDNGIHASRMAALAQNIRETAAERQIQVLVTTHNPSLMDAVPPSNLGDVLCCYRDPGSGESKIIRLGDLDRFPQLMARGKLGALMTSDLIGRFIKDTKSEAQKRQEAFTWLEELEKAVDS